MNKYTKFELNLFIFTQVITFERKRYFVLMSVKEQILGTIKCFMLQLNADLDSDSVKEVKQHRGKQPLGWVTAKLLVNY